MHAVIRSLSCVYNANLVILGDGRHSGMVLCDGETCHIVICLDLASDRLRIIARWRNPVGSNVSSTVSRPRGRLSCSIYGGFLIVIDDERVSSDASVRVSRNAIGVVADSEC